MKSTRHNAPTAYIEHVRSVLQHPIVKDRLQCKHMPGTEIHDDAVVFPQRLLDSRQKIAISNGD